MLEPRLSETKESVLCYLPPSSLLAPLCRSCTSAPDFLWPTSYLSGTMWPRPNAGSAKGDGSVDYSEGKQKLLTIKFGKAPAAAPQEESCAKCKEAGSVDSSRGSSSSLRDGCKCAAEPAGKRKRFSLKRPAAESKE
jgi:hypothetical protein